MNVAGINFESVADGEGVRVVIYVSGCLHNCKGCHNPTSHSFTAGQPFTEQLQEEIITYINNTPFISGLTLSGGDPMYSAEEITPFVRALRQANKNVTVWIYSGFSYEEILENSEMLELLSVCDVLVDGRFILEQRDMTLSYKGSRNQRIIDVQQSLQCGNIVLWENDHAK
ncbi:MAG: anaerobic ribonucleoside-triphosphate reductase activating protein [Lachnospiraceae bacterium]|nr:anaerobic ribonucleoside-triphosphate reductase activating protein [Lachnospiraceae bacterium]